MPNFMGKNVKGGYIIGGIAGIAGLGYFWYKHKQSAATAATPATSAYGYGNQYGYGGYGYNNPAFNEPYIGGEYGYGGAYGYGIGEGYGVGSPYPPNAPTQLATTNAAWAQAAEQYLSQTGGYDAGTVAAALGIYITGSTLSAAQQAVVEAAIAFEGYPPQSGANGYPPAMHTSTSTGQGGGGGGGGGTNGKVTVPSITGLSIDNAGVTLSSEGLKIRVISPPVRNHQFTYTILTQTPKAGSQANKNSSVNVTAKKGAKV
jgi:hypothetical protein